jgi:hypothetical protein
MSGASGTWLSTHAVQLAVTIGDDGHLMSGASGAWPVHMQFKFVFACGAFFFVLQTFPFLFRSSFPFFFPFGTFWTVGFSEA